MRLSIMGRACVTAGCLAFALMSRPSLADDGEGAMAPRAFGAFVADAATTPGSWAELGGAYARHGDLKAGEGVVHLSIAEDLWEAGALLPAGYVETPGYLGDSKHSGLGDLSFWAKVLPWRTETFSAGGGLAIAVPTSTDDMGVGEVGLEPFATLGFSFNGPALRASVGYAAYVTGGDDFDSIDYSVGAYVPLGELVTLRTELLGAHFDRIKVDTLSIAPGVDFTFRLDAMNLLLRPTVAAGITDDSPDYQLALSVALVWPR